MTGRFSGSSTSKRTSAVFGSKAPRQRRAELVADPAYVEQVLADGAAKARLVARATLSRVRAAMGLRAL